MVTSQTGAQKSEITSVRDAIYKRRSIRRYRPDPVSLDQVHTLLAAAAQASGVLHEDPWEFAVVQDKDLLKSLSDDVKESVNKEVKARMPELSEESDFNVFYNAGTLIVIYSRNQEPFAGADCWLAAENLMLTAYAEGLGTCVIGLAIAALNSLQWKSRLGIGENSIAIAPIIIGVPEGNVPAASGKKPEIAA